LEFIDDHLENNWLGLERQRIIMELYKDQETMIRIEDCISTTRIRRRVKQSYFLSPYLFNIFIEVVKKFKVKAKGVK